MQRDLGPGLGAAEPRVGAPGHRPPSCPRVPRQVESWETQEMWRGFILTMSKVGSGLCPGGLGVTGPLCATPPCVSPPLAEKTPPGPGAAARTHLPAAGGSAGGAQGQRRDTGDIPGLGDTRVTSQARAPGDTRAAGHTRVTCRPRVPRPLRAVSRGSRGSQGLGGVPILTRVQPGPAGAVPVWPGVTRR